MEKYSLEYYVLMGLNQANVELSPAQGVVGLCEDRKRYRIEKISIFPRCQLYTRSLDKADRAR
jgi:hypothetical protein